MKNIAVIAALDIVGGYSKDDSSPFNSEAGMAYFKEMTMGHICVMGKSTYESLSHITSGEQTSILPGRECFVITNNPDTVSKALATPISDIGELNLDLLKEGEKKAFFMGGQSSWDIGLSLGEEAYISVFAEDYSCDRFFRTGYLMEHFVVVDVVPAVDDCNLVFLKYKRKG